jgi:hypothetical protein
MNAKISKGRAVAHKKRGIWVFRVDAPLEASVVDETIRRVWEEREQQVLGKKWNPRDKAQ